MAIVVIKSEEHSAGDSAVRDDDRFEGPDAIDNAIKHLEALRKGERTADGATKPTDPEVDTVTDTITAPELNTELKGKTPDDFPGKAALDEAGYTTYAKVRKLAAAGELTTVPGVGQATADRITEALAAAPADELPA